MNVFSIPNGPLNIASLFPGVDFSQMEEYFIEVVDTEGTVVATTTLNQMDCCCSDEKIRLHFINALGTDDAINFIQPLEELDTKSDTRQRPLSYPLIKSEGGFVRNSVQSNETISASNVCYTEADQEWIKELFASPMAWLEWVGTEGQPNGYIPVVITDKKFTSKKVDGRHTYETKIQFYMSNDRFSVRT